MSKREMRERFGRENTIQEPEVPEDGENLWSVFWQLNRRRQQGFNGPQPISLTEMALWLRMTGEILLREEVSIILDMDDAYLSALAEVREDQAKANKKS